LCPELSNPKNRKRKPNLKGREQRTDRRRLNRLQAIEKKKKGKRKKYRLYTGEFSKLGSQAPPRKKVRKTGS